MMIRACWRAPMNMTASTYNTGCQKNVQSAIAAAIAAHSRAVAVIALPGSSAESFLTTSAGNRSWMALLVLCGWTTTGLLEMSCVGISDPRKSMTLLTLAKYGIGLVTHDYHSAVAHSCVHSWAF